MNKTLEGMEAAYNSELKVQGEWRVVKGGMQTALLWLADNVGDEMVRASKRAQSDVLSLPADIDTDTIHRACISAALRAAGEGR